MDPAPQPQPRHRARLRSSALLLLTALGALAALTGVQRLRSRLLAERIPVYGVLPAFTLTDQRDQPFTDAALHGHISIADFIFTRCPTVCPTLTRRMLRLQQLARERGLELRFVSFSVDPGYDTPERLRDYALKHGIDTSNWSLVTGPLDTVETTVLEGFRILMGRDADAGEDDFLSIFHGEHFVLVDAQGRIRGYYTLMADESALELLLRDASALAEATASR